MPDDLFADETLLQRLPLPLAQLHRRAHNAKTILERHNTAFYCWEAGLKLLASGAIIEYAELPEHDPALAERLTALARPSLGHWWEFARKLVPVLAQHDEGFAHVRELLLGKSRDDLPRVAGLDAVLREALDGKKQARTTVNLAELFDRLVRYRNQELGHGASGRRPAEHYRVMAAAFGTGLGELLGRLDCLAGRRLIYVSDVRQQPTGAWLVERVELVGEAGRRIESLTVAGPATPNLPTVERIYLEGPRGLARSLHPLAIYDANEEEVLLLNSRRGRQRTEYLGYTSGRVVDRPDLGGEQRALLSRILGMQVDLAQAAEWAARSQAEEPAGAAEPQAPTASRQIGEFELLSELGRGGMGVVYRAWQPSLGREVALKRLQRAGDARAEARFAREIQALGRVEHPHLIKIFTSGAEGEHWFYAMELVEGATLGAVCERLQQLPGGATSIDAHTWQDALSTVCEEVRKAEKPLSDGAADGSPGSPRRVATAPEHAEGAAVFAGHNYVRHIAGLMIQVAEAAHALHEAGILHRDIKPGNILVTHDGQQAILMDLGLAQLADDVEGRLTRTRQFVGTLRYASPQQVLAVGRLDRRTDVYSLGATLWELLALQPIFDATEETPTPLLMEKIQREEPERLRKHHPGIPRDLEAIVHRCLEKTPDKRYATAHDLASDLRHFLDGEPVRARPVTAWERAWKWVRRHPATAAVYGLVILVTVLQVIGGSMAWLWQEAVSARSDAEDALVREQAAKQKAEDALRGEKSAKDKAEEAQHATADALLKEKNALAELSRVQRRAAYVDRIQLVARTAGMGQFDLARGFLDAGDPEFRNWEWGYLGLRTHEDLFTLTHSDRASQVAFGPDGKILAAASLDGTIKLWQADTGKELHTLKASSGAVTSIAFSPDGKLLASAGADKTVRLWHVDAGTLAHELAGHTDSVWYVAFSPKNGLLATASQDSTARLWDAASGKELQTLGGHSRQVDRVAFSPDGGLVATASRDGTTRLWQVADGKLQFTLSGHAESTAGQAVHNAVFRPDGKVLATTGGDAAIKLWRVDQGTELFTLRGHNDVISSMAFSPDGRWLASGSKDSTIKLWRVDTGKEGATLRGHTAGISGVAFSPDGLYLATGSFDCTLKIWQAATAKELATLRGHSLPIVSVAFRSDGQLLATAGLDKIVKVWQVEAHEELRTLRGSFNGFIKAAFRPDGRRVAACSADGTADVWDAETGVQLMSLNHASSIKNIAWSNDGKLLATAGDDGLVRLWDADTGQLRQTLTGHTRPVYSVAFSPDGQLIASAGWDNLGKVWRVDTGKEISTLRGHNHALVCVTFSPDSKRVATSSLDKTARIWDALTGKQLFELAGHGDVVQRVAFSPDAQRLVTVSWDTAIKIWDADTGSEIVTLRSHRAAVFDFAFSPDGKTFASASLDSTAKLWQLDTGKEVMTLQGHTDKVVAVAFTPDGKRVATVSDDKTAKVWDAVSGRELLTLGPTNSVVVAFDRDGKQLLAIGPEATVLVWTSSVSAEVLARRQEALANLQAFVSERTGQWFAATYYLGLLLQREPQNGFLLLRQGTALAEQQQWDAAIQDFGASCVAQPRLSRFRLPYAAAFLAQRRMGPFRRICRQMVNEFGDGLPPFYLTTTLSLTTITPDAVQDHDHVVRLAESQAKAFPNFWEANDLLGRARYRAGDFRGALTALQKSLTLQATASVYSKLFLAMTQERLGNHIEARSWLQDAVKLLDQADQFEAAAVPGQMPRTWIDRVVQRVIRAEAEQLVNGPAPGK
jgi:WD40 repeat protein/serine/threonine protein kinase